MAFNVSTVLSGDTTGPTTEARTILDFSYTGLEIVQGQIGHAFSQAVEVHLKGSAKRNGPLIGRLWGMLRMCAFTCGNVALSKCG